MKEVKRCKNKKMSDQEDEPQVQGGEGRRSEN
jgi:hypothetical protein